VNVKEHVSMRTLCRDVSLFPIARDLASQAGS
jgi:hypothetical protein